MPRHLVNAGTLTIPSGTAVSNVINSRLAFGSAADMIIYAPATLPETVTVKVAGKDSETNVTNMKSLYVSGADITIPAGKAVVIPSSSFGSLALSSGSNVAADRVFDVYCQEDI